MSLNRNVARSVREWVGAWPDDPDQKLLYRVLRYLAQWRSVMLANTYVRQQGTRIHGGPFAGMDYLAETPEGALIPRLLGTYESELHPHLEAFIAGAPERIVDVGCAEGYYAVGLARRLPHAEIHAHDIDPAARAACAALAEKNGVAARVQVGGEVRPGDFEPFAPYRTLVIVDTEGAEVDLLQPAASPALASMALIVETHDLNRPGALATLQDRFAATHDITVVRQAAKILDPPAWLDGLNQLDQLIAVWEWRLQPTPWLVMRPKAGWGPAPRHD